MTSLFDWQEIDRERARQLSANGSRRLAVFDDLVCHVTRLPGGMSVADALADYAAGYDAGEPKTPCSVGWELYQGGEEKRRGRHRFESR